LNLLHCAQRDRRVKWDCSK